MISAEVEVAVKARLASYIPLLLTKDIENIADTTLPARSVAVWVALEFPPSLEDVASEGDPENNLWREEGVFMVHVYVPTGTGSVLAKSTARDIYELYRGQEFDGVRCFGREIGEQGPRWNGNWWGISYAMPFQYDRTP